MALRASQPQPEPHPGPAACPPPRRPDPTTLRPKPPPSERDLRHSSRNAPGGVGAARHPTVTTSGGHESGLPSTVASGRRITVAVATAETRRFKQSSVMTGTSLSHRSEPLLMPMSGPALMSRRASRPFRPPPRIAREPCISPAIAYLCWPSMSKAVICVLVVVWGVCLGVSPVGHG